MSTLTWAAADRGIVRPMLTGGDTSTPRVDRAFAAAAWSCLIEPGDSVAGTLIAQTGPDVALRSLLDGDLAGLARAADLPVADIRAGLDRWRPRLSVEPIAFALQTARRIGVRLLTSDDPEWPRGLEDLGPHAPVCLWVRGDPTVLAFSGPMISIVGARAASGYGEHIAAELAADLVGRGMPVVSGAAYGIDGAAHQAALATRGVTIALVAGGVDRAYPAGHADLLGRIAASGAVVGETPCGTAPTKWRFLQRNRNIAALGSATVVVEAGWRSGSLNTAAHAAALGRPLGAVPGPVTSGTSAGCHRLLREFDARCITCADDIAELVGIAPVPTQDPRVPRRSGETTRIIDALSTRAWRDVADIARRSGMSTAEASAHLGVLELDGSAHRRGDDWRRAATGSGG